MSGSMCGPGGRLFEGWYDVRKESGPVRMFNGERLRRL